MLCFDFFFFFLPTWPVIDDVEGGGGRKRSLESYIEVAGHGKMVGRRLNDPYGFMK